MDLNANFPDDINHGPDKSKRHTEKFQSSSSDVELDAFAETKIHSSINCHAVANITANKNSIDNVPSNIDVNELLHNGEHLIPEKLSEENETDSWDTFSQSSVSSEHLEHDTSWLEVSGIKKPTSSDLMRLMPPELPMLCNIAQQVHGEENVSIELTFIDVDNDDSSWKSISYRKEQMELFLNNLNGSSCDSDDESHLDNIHTADFSVQASLSQEELVHDTASSSADVSSQHSLQLPGLEIEVGDFDVQNTHNSTVNHDADKICNKVPNRTEASLATRNLISDFNNHRNSNNLVVANKQENEHKKQCVYKRKSYSTGRISPDNLDNNKQCRPTASWSANKINQIALNQIPFTSCNTDAEIGDTVSCTIKSGDCCSKSLLKQYINPVQPLRLHPQNDIAGSRNVVYECHVVSVANLPPNNSSSNTNLEENSEHTASAVPLDQREPPLVAGSSEEEMEAGSEAASAPAKEVKHRPIKQPMGRMLIHGTGHRTEASEAWVLLDAEGNTQEVTQRDVNILLGGRSADSVVAESTAHPISHCAVERATRSETGAQEALLEPLIQESLLLLSHDDSGGEQLHPRRLHLERKAGNMLLYIGMDMNLVPSVRFINVDTQIVQMWRHTQEDSNRSLVNDNFNIVD